MMSVGMMIELLVAFLLVLTIGYCVTLNRRLKRLRNDEEALRATIAELITATEIAERAILGLKATAGECDKTLAHRLMEAERLSSELQYYVNQGEGVVGRLVKISDAVRGSAAQSRRAADPALRDMSYGNGRGGYPEVPAQVDDGLGLRAAPVVEGPNGSRSLKDMAAQTSERLMAIRQKRGAAA